MPDRTASIVVWSVWTAMLLIDLSVLALAGRNVPLAEDWELVAALSGHEPDLLRWLWSQNNEHRVPLPRLILLGLLELSGGDFRVGMVLNILTLAALAAAAMGTARALRGGRTRVVDAVFPLLLLHLGHWPNLFWSWQFTFVLSVALTIALLLVLVRRDAPTTPVTAAVASLCLLLLPLCGATGLLLVPALALWLGYRGLALGGRIGAVLIGAALLAFALTALYFVGYVHPTWNPPNPGLVATLQTCALFLAMGLGPTARHLPTAMMLVAAFMLIPAAWLAVQAVLHRRGEERWRARGIALFCCNLGALALAIAYGRAGYMPTVGMPPRYVLLAAPLYCAVFFLWELYGSDRWRAIGQRALLVVAAALVPLNALSVRFWWWEGHWYDRGMTAVERDIRAGHTPEALAAEHRDFLVHWWDEERLAEGMRRLHALGSGPFSLMRIEPTDTR